MVPTTTEPTDVGRSQAMNGLQLISTLASHGMLSLLLDGPKLFPMLLAFMKAPWIQTGVSHIAFAVVYNLCILNGARLPVLVDAGGIATVSEYLKSGVDANPTGDSAEVVAQKRNLALSVLYLIGSVKSEAQSKFIEEGGLTTVLEYLNVAKSVLVFLSSFISIQTPPEVINIIMSHPLFSEAVDSMYADEPEDSDSEDEEEPQDEESRKEHMAKLEAAAKTHLVAQVLRNLCQIKGSADTILPLLPRFLGHDLVIADEALSALSNLVGTQEVDFRYAWDSSLIGMTLSRAAQLCEALIESAEADEAAAVVNTNIAGRRHVLARVLQILRSEECFKAAAENSDAGRPGQEKDAEADADEEDDEDSDKDSDANEFDDKLVFTRDDALQLVQLAKLNTDLLEAHQSWARTVSRYLSLVPSSVVWIDENDGLVDIVSDTVIAEKDVSAEIYSATAGADAAASSAVSNGSEVALPILYTDSEFDLAKAMEGVEFRDVPICVMWRRLSNIPLEGVKITSASYDTIAAGVIGSTAIAAVMTGLARHLRKLLGVFRLPSGSQLKWGSAPISINLYDLQTKKPVTVTVDDRVPCYVCGRPLGMWSGSTQTWLPLIEKACAKLVGGYAALAALTFEEAAELLTGVKPVKCKLPAEDQLLNVIESELAEKSVLIYLAADSTQTPWIVDSVSATPEGSTINSYTAALFDPRRGWTENIGHDQSPASKLHANIHALYKLKLE